MRIFTTACMLLLMGGCMDYRMFPPAGGSPVKANPPPPDIFHAVVDGYDVEVETYNFSMNKFSSTSQVASVEAANAIANDKAVDPTAPPQWKALEIVAKEKCPYGYRLDYRSWLPTDPIGKYRMDIRYECTPTIGGG